MDTLTKEQVDALVRGEDPPELWNAERECVSDWVTRALAVEVQQARQRLGEKHGPRSARTESERANYLAAGRMRGEVE